MTQFCWKSPILLKYTTIGLYNELAKHLIKNANGTRSWLRSLAVPYSCTKWFLSSQTGSHCLLQVSTMQSNIIYVRIKRAGRPGTSLLPIAYVHLAAIVSLQTIFSAPHLQTHTQSGWSWNIIIFVYKKEIRHLIWVVWIHALSKYSKIIPSRICG